MKVLHIALAVNNLESSIEDYTQRVGAEPVVVAPEQYALWRTPQVNLSISQNIEQAGQLRHLGFEDASATQMSESFDVNGILWERFTAQQQRDEIANLYPNAIYSDADL